MLISDLLKHKGSSVVTIGPHETITSMVRTLSDNGIGAVVVLDAGAIIGIASERDVVRAIAARGSGVLGGVVRDIMTTQVVSCAPKDPVESVAALMTERRVRHLPVVSDGQLAGIVTIGDVVAARIRQLEQDRGQLEHYITQG
jgi:CBS domain-containing protein